MSIIKQFFLDTSSFDSSRDGVIPWRRDPISLGLRLVYNISAMTFSGHPEDILTWAHSMMNRHRPMEVALPWINFSAIRFLQSNVRKGARVFEYGSGHSSLFWARREAELHSVEDNKDWYELVKSKLQKENADVYLVHAAGEAYVKAIEKCSGKFDVIVVDGTDREACITTAINKLATGGILVVDNTDWEWLDGIDGLIPSHWQKRIFTGFAPFIGYPSETTIWTSS